MYPVSGMNNMPPRGVDPNAYAQQYANQNGLTLDEAKAELKAKYGDPTQGASLFSNGFNQNNTSGPTNAGDPQPHLRENGYVSTDFSGSSSNVGGPQKEGDPQPHLDSKSNGTSGPINAGDPQPHLEGQDGQGSKFANFLRNIGFQIFNNPDTYAQKYAAENNLSLEEAKAELKEKYGEPQQLNFQA